MTKKFADRLEEFLSTECEEYGLKYSWEWCEGNEWCEVEVSVEHTENKAHIEFTYDEEKDDLKVSMGEDSWEVTREFDSTVKYFWLLVAPKIFKG